MKRIFAVVLFILGIAPTSFAGCDKGFTDRLNFTLDNASTGFSAIAGPERGGTQHDLTPAAEAFCPNIYILNHYPATKDSLENWNIKFTYHRTGTLDDVTTGLIKELNPALVARGYQDKPFIKDGTLGGYLLEWDDPNGTWITVETWADDSSGPIWFEVRVWHDVKAK
jgi:hypothetical protein